jgi:hypothetical protein
LDTSLFEGFACVCEIALGWMRCATKGALPAALKGVKAGQKVLFVATALNEKAHARSS